MAKKSTKKVLAAKTPQPLNFLDYYHYTYSHEELFDQFVDINYVTSTDRGMTLNYIIDEEHVLSIVL